MHVERDLLWQWSSMGCRSSSAPQAVPLGQLKNVRALRYCQCDSCTLAGMAGRCAAAPDTHAPMVHEMWHAQADVLDGCGGIR